MNQVFKPYLRKFVLVFFDDILVYSKIWGEHLSHVQRVLELLAKNHLVVQGDRLFGACYFQREHSS